jgi:hypothetical protein
MKRITKLVGVSCSLPVGVSYFALRADYELQMTDLAFDWNTIHAEAELLFPLYWG